MQINKYLFGDNIPPQKSRKDRLSFGKSIRGKSGTAKNRIMSL